MNELFESIHYNNTLRDWLISGALIASALIINWIIHHINRRYLKALARRTKNYYDNIIVNSLETPLKVGIVLATIWFAFSRLDMSESFDQTIYKVYKILTVLNLTWFIVHLINGTLREYFNKKNFQHVNGSHKLRYDVHFVSIIQKTTTSIVWIIGLVSALNNVGLDLKAILGTLGIGGIALALAAQDTVKNIFGGFTVLLDGTFRIGDRVKVGEHEGEVEDIGIRSTKIRNLDNQIITIPNYKIVEGPVINLSVAKTSRVITHLGLRTDTSAEKMTQAVEMLNHIAASSKEIANDGISVSFNEFGSSSLNLQLIYFVNNPANKSEVVSKINLEILKSMNDKGIQFASPSQDINFISNTLSKIKKE